MTPRFLLDTPIVVRWITEPKKLSPEQGGIIRNAEKHGQPVGASGITLHEIAVQHTGSAKAVLNAIGADPLFQILPLTIAIAAEMATLIDKLRDQFDCAIVATARVHGLTLLTSDQRIIETELVSVFD